MEKLIRSTLGASAASTAGGGRVGAEGLAALGRRFELPPWAAVLAWLATLAAVAIVVTVKIDLAAQFCLSFSVVGAMILLRRTRNYELARLFFLLCSGFLTFRYLYWRTTSTLTYYGVADFTFSLLLYGAEIYGIVVASIGLFINSRPLTRRVAPLVTNAGPLPSVDVFIPTYNESPELLETTLRAALDIRYPRERLNVYLLDDGGTAQKLAQADATKAAEARARAEALREMTARHGGIYLTRERNEHAKAGNINAGLALTSGDLIVIFDADHVPTADFLEKTVGFFQRDEQLCLVQTPHFFINPDPLEKNLGMFGKMPPESEMFYSVIQPGLDFWNASFFCGSAAVLRRRCVMEIGGITGQSITEDAETALTLHSRGYRSLYLNEPLISGLQPETFASFVVQRVRWAQGMIQLLLLRNPLRMKGLTLPQRICYFSNAFFWFFCYARVVFLIAPAMYLLFGLQFYHATIPQFFAYGLPQMLGAILTTDYLFGRHRWTLISEIYELLISMFSLRGVLSVLIKPRAPTFKVTPKGEQLDADAISELAGPFYVVYLCVLVSAVTGVWKLLHDFPHKDVIAASLGWSMLNLILLNACIGVLYERKQRRAAPRIPADLPATLHIDGRASGTNGTLAGRIVDMSAGGVKLMIPGGAPSSPLAHTSAILEVFNPSLGRTSRIAIAIRASFRVQSGALAVGAQFADRSVAGLSEQVALVYGDSARWREFRASRNQRIGILRSLALVVRLGTVHALHHHLAFFAGMRECALGRLAAVKRAFQSWFLSRS
ncbi:UDP-forming cellulose synthase catalytic subunit [Trinickia terrae]|uniref:Cellulose synthase catalytic subunit [UDP-forming] n=1 Tax=Trinickia terrae TaxID=2571161 RepID=A0A4U1HBG1_9BURK|nr:UDP-forming cellulose synthase catalytic subunit [Trinickia terrae]TKC78082.1 UDP-forming cellulose synthase catalytic subunit [Trinickia terrae]